MSIGPSPVRWHSAQVGAKPACLPVPLPVPGASPNPSPAPLAHWPPVSRSWFHVICQGPAVPCIRPLPGFHTPPRFLVPFLFSREVRIFISSTRYKRRGPSSPPPPDFSFLSSSLVIRFRDHKSGATSSRSLSFCSHGFHSFGSVNPFAYSRLTLIISLSKRSRRRPATSFRTTPFFRFQTTISQRRQLLYFEPLLFSKQYNWSRSRRQLPKF